MNGTGKTIDWASVHDRLKASNQALARALAPDEAAIAAVQKRRAAYLASRADRSAKKAGLPVLIFSAAGERYAVELEQISEISGATTCTPVPGNMDMLLGLANLHGEIRPVLDPIPLLEIPRKGATNRTPGAVLYLRWGSKEIGIGADHLEGIVHLDRTQLAALPPEGAAMPRRFIKAITAETLALIDVPGLLAGMGIVSGDANDSMQEGKRA